MTKFESKTLIHRTTEGNGFGKYRVGVGDISNTELMTQTKKPDDFPTSHNFGSFWPNNWTYSEPNSAVNHLFKTETLMLVNNEAPNNYQYIQRKDTKISSQRLMMKSLTAQNKIGFKPNEQKNQESTWRPINAILTNPHTMSSLGITSQLIPLNVKQTPKVNSSFKLVTPDPGVCSPFPSISFSPLSSIESRQQQTLSKVVQELADSEKIYLTSIKLFNRNYIVLSSFEGIEAPIPFKFLTTYFKALEDHHTQLLKSMTKIMNKNLPIQNLAIEISQLVGKHAIKVYVYKGFCDNYQMVVDLISNFSKITHTGQYWLKGWGKFLEATQPHDQYLDLSFFSLLQKPLGRAGKYKLILNSLAKHSLSNCDIIQENLKEISHRLDQINDTSAEYASGTLPTKKLNDMITFKNVDFVSFFELSIDYFGPLLLCGSMALVMIDNLKVKLCHCGAFLFKTHLILVELKSVRSADIYSLNHDKLEPLFIIPLSKSSFTSDMRDFDGGLFTTYPFTLKLRFEVQKCVLETFLLFLTPKEFKVWKDNFQILQQFVKSEANQIDVDKELLVLRYPKSMSFVDMHASQHRRVNGNCYFKDYKDISVEVKVSCKVCSTRKLDHPPTDSTRETTVIIKESLFMAIQRTFKDFWSREIPKYEKCTEHGEIEGRTKCWYNLKFKRFQSLHNKREASKPHFAPGSSEY